MTIESGNMVDVIAAGVITAFQLEAAKPVCKAAAKVRECVENNGNVAPGDPAYKELCRALAEFATIIRTTAKVIS